LENPILKSEPKNESDVVVKPMDVVVEEEKSIKKSKSKNGMYGVLIFLMNSMVFCQSSKLIRSLAAMFFKFEAENLTPHVRLNRRKN
jgi:hypothetical protein